MSFVKSTEWITEHIKPTVEFYGAEMLTISYETRPEIIERLLPPPLKPSSLPVVNVFLATYPNTNFGVKYLESCLLVKTKYNDEEGCFIVSMPVTDDMALVTGRELYGYPKKMADIELKRSGNMVSGWTERHGVKFMELKANLTGRSVNSHAEETADQFLVSLRDSVVFTFKCFGSPDRMGFDYNPRLVREIVSFRPEKIELAEAEIILRPSEHDPWADIEIVRVLGAAYTVGNNTMHPGAVVAEVDPMAFLPYVFMKFDNT